MPVQQRQKIIIAAPTRSVVGITLPAIALGQTKTIPVAWQNELPSASYGIHITTWPANPGLSVSLSQAVVPGSKTPTGFSLSVKALVALAANSATLDVAVIHP